MSSRLMGDGSVVDLGDGYSLRAPGLRGVAELDKPEDRVRRGGRRGVEPASSSDLDRALAEAGLTERMQVNIEAAPDAPVRRRRDAGSIGVTETADLVTPEPPDGHEQVVLLVDEDGVVTWHIPETAEEPRRRALPQQGRHYRIRVRGGNGAAPPARRGVFSVVGRKIAKVLVFPITDVILGAAGRVAALAWEQAKAPYGIRTFDAANFKDAKAGAVTADDWTRLAAGPALLYVHGTFSTAHGCFAGLERATFDELAAAYQGRTFAFNHWTLSHDPRENVSWFLGEVAKAGVNLQADIVCHSRGGLVARALAEAGGARGVNVRRIVFVATPNDGTLLAQAKHMVHMLDRYTNISTFLPDGPVEIAFEAVAAAVKAVAHAGLKSLPGLRAQDPDGDFLKELKQKEPGSAALYSMAADFEPSPGNLRELILEGSADLVMDSVFKQEKNDLVVPTAGVGEPRGAAGFPVDAERRFSFAPSDGVVHTNFFRHAKTNALLREWLRKPAPEPEPA